MSIKKIIIDTDLGWDDVLSILYLMKDPSIHILGVTVTGCGETNLRWGGVIAKTLMDLGNQTQAVVCLGSEHPLAGSHTFPQSFKNDMNDIMGLLGTLNPLTDQPIDCRPAWQFIADTIVTEKVTIVSLGGFTNLAYLLRHYPDANISNIEHIYAMAGALFVDGNIAALNNSKPEWDQGPIYSTNQVAEWNVFIDPLSALSVFESSLPLTLIPLDACNVVILNSNYSNVIAAKDPIATLAQQVFFEKSGGHAEGTLSVPIFDPLATMVMTGGLEEIQIDSYYLSVNLQDSMINNQCGKIFPVSQGSRKINVVRAVSQAEFASNYAAVINSECKSPRMS
jgi:purine nucleosidase